MPPSLTHLELAEDHDSFEDEYGDTRYLWTALYNQRDDASKVLIDALPPTLKHLAFNRLRTRYHRTFVYLIKHLPPALQSLDLTGWFVSRRAWWTLVTAALPSTLKAIKVDSRVNHEFMDVLTPQLPQGVALIQPWVGERDGRREQGVAAAEADTTLFADDPYENDEELDGEPELEYHEWYANQVDDLNSTYRADLEV
ncbi:hypothetical protein H9P43_007042 [Blastocladiella emersonii ATCC 22665]|nr:hypothetical protein H9P43_007042 [Blastocladiella emersonii ATCC 22665]